MKTCEVCGQAVETVSGDEGTNYYKGLERKQAFNEAISIAESLMSVDMYKCDSTKTFQAIPKRMLLDKLREKASGK